MDNYILPHSLEIEKAVLGGAFNPLTNEMLTSRINTPEMFYDPFNQLLFKCIKDLNKEGNHLTPELVFSKLVDMGEGENFSLLSLFDMVDNAPVSPEPYERYLNILIDKYTRRKIYFEQHKFKEELMEAKDKDILSIVSKFQSQLTSLSTLKNSSSLEQIGLRVGDVVKSFREITPENYRDKIKERYMPTGFDAIDNTIHGLKRKGLIILAARPAMGKELDVNTNLLTPDGWIKIGESKVGDKIIGSDGNQYNITGVFPQGQKDIYRIFFDDGTYIDSGLEHQWEVTTRSIRKKAKHKQKPIVVKTSDMLGNVRLKDNRCNYAIKINKPVYQFNNEFEGKFSGEYCDAWLVGLYIGDGYSKNNSIEICNPEKDLIDRVKLLLPDNDEMNSSDGIHWRVTNNNQRSSFSKLIEKLGLIGKKSHEKFIPKELLLADSKTRTKLLQGIVDSDGYVTGSRFVDYATTSKQLCEDILFLVRSLGGKASYVTKRGHYTKDGKRTPTRLVYRITFSMGMEVIPCSSEKHLAKYKPGKKFHCKFITDIKKLDQQTEMVCISVDSPDHLYIVEGFNLTHNSALMSNIAFNIAINEKKPVAIFSIEMSTEEIIERTICSYAEVSYDNFVTGTVPEDKWKSIDYWSAKIKACPMYIVDQDIDTVSKIKGKLMELKQEVGEIGAVFIDYLQLMDDPGTDKRTLALDNISKQLKFLAKEYGCPVVALSQLSREVEKRNDKRPMLSDLRESGQIEANADMVFGLYRDEYYNLESEYKKVAEVNTLKNRGGVTAKMKLYFDARYTKFKGLLI